MSVSLSGIHKKKFVKLPTCRSELISQVNSKDREVKSMERCFDYSLLMDECESEVNRSLDGMIDEMIANNETSTAAEHVVGMVRSLQPELKLEMNRILLLLEEAEMLKDRLKWERNVLKEEHQAVRDDMTQYEDYICNEQYYNFKNATWDALKNVGRDELHHRRSKLQKMRNDLNGKYQMLYQKIRVYQFLLSKLNEEEIQREQRCHALSLNILSYDASKAQFYRNLIEYVKTEIDRTHFAEKFITSKLKHDVVHVKETWSQNILNAQQLGCTFDFVLQHRVNKGGSRGDYNAVAGIFEKEMPVFHADAICEKSTSLMKKAFEKQRTRLEKEMDVYLWMTNAKSRKTRVPDAAGTSVSEQPKSDLTPQNQLQKPEREEDAPKNIEVQENASEKLKIKDDKNKDVEHCNQRIEEKRRKNKKPTKKLEEKTDELVKSMSEVKEVNKAILKTLDSLKLLEQEKIDQSNIFQTKTDERILEKKCADKHSEEAKSSMRHKEIDETKDSEDENALQKTTETLSAFITRNEDLGNKWCCFHPADLSIEEIKRLALLQMLKKLHDFLKRNEETRQFVDSEELLLNLLSGQSLSLSIISQFLNNTVLKLRRLEISEMKRMETKDFRLRDVYDALMYLTNNEVIAWNDEDLCDEVYSKFERDKC